MELHHYKDFFTVPANYRANMTREAINETPDTWLNFYPHDTFVKLLNTLFDKAKSVWITGNFGTGKSNASLVVQKLFMDDIERVNRWFSKNKEYIKNIEALKTNLLEARNSGTFVVYDYNASGIGPHEEFLVRLEKGIISALEERNMRIPAKADIDVVIDRLYREGDNFFSTRDSMQSELQSLKADIKDIDTLALLLREESTSKTPTHYLEDVQAVLRKDNIYLSINTSSFRSWISEILRINKLERIIYIFDEFSEFVEANSSQLKTFEDVTEAPDVNHFYLVPVTHKEPAAFLGENAPGANRAKDRFYFRNLTMPNDIAFQLAHYAMEPVDNIEIQNEWKQAKDSLWSSVRTVVDRFTDPENSANYVSHQSFYDILPIHPMAAFLLKFLAEHARSNQRSIFEYLKGSADGREFQEFIAKGGPDIVNAQYLTPDYLWKYFMERSDAGQSREITDVKLEYDRIIAREYKNYNDDQAEIRVLKTVMLFALLSHLAPEGHERLMPTVENVELSFRGDGTVMDVAHILKDMSENKHCFSIVDGSIDLYSSTVSGDEVKKKVAELEGQFHELVSETCKVTFEETTKGARGVFSGERFDIRVSDIGHTTMNNINVATREKYGTGLAKDTGSVCLWFVVAKNKAEQQQIPEKSNSLITNLRDHRIIMLTFPENTFCKENTNLWNEYVTLYAQYLLENNTTAKDQIKRNFESISRKWLDGIKIGTTQIEVRYYDTKIGNIVCERYTWSQLKSFLRSYVERYLDACPDTLTDQMTVFTNKGLKSWALAGIKFTGTAQQGQLVNALKSQGVTADDSWFENHQEHVFGKLRTLLEKKYANTVGKGSTLSLRKVYIELKRAPYGMRYNCLSAFTLGFCTAWMLQKNCQWTNNQLNQPLDEDTLAEIIESTVSEKTDKEKFICHLSKEDKAFAKNASCMFGLPPLEDSVPLKTLEVISSEVESNSMKVPLWILADYIREKHPEHITAAEILDKLCIALKISSKGNTDEKSSVITAIGTEIRTNPNIVETVALYTKSETYITAFRYYVDKADPELVDLALKIEDHSYEYCDMILRAAVPTSGWLWNKSDISTLIDTTHNNYRFMDIARSLLQVSGYAPLSDIIERIEEKIDESGLPYAIVKEKYPPIKRLIEELNGKQDAFQLMDSLQDSYDVFSALYNDPQKKASTALVLERAGELKINEDELANIISTMVTNTSYEKGMSSDSYIKLIKASVEKNVRNLMLGKAMQEWLRITGTKSFDEWYEETKLPSWTVLSGVDSCEDIVKMLQSPESYTTDTLSQTLSALEVLPTISISDCQAAFMRRIIPGRYRKLDIKLPSLLKYLSSAYNNKNPDKWPIHPDISGFVKEQYETELAPNVVSGLKNKDAVIIKNRILELAKTDPDIGLKLLEMLEDET